MNDLQKTWVLTGKQNSDEKKNRNNNLDLSEKKPNGTQGPYKHQLDVALVKGKK